MSILFSPPLAKSPSGLLLLFTAFIRISARNFLCRDENDNRYKQCWLIDGNNQLMMTTCQVYRGQKYADMLNLLKFIGGSENDQKSIALR